MVNLSVVLYDPIIDIYKKTGKSEVSSVIPFLFFFTPSEINDHCYCNH